MITCPARHYMKKDDHTGFRQPNDSWYLWKNVCMMSGLDDITIMITHHLKWDFIGIDVANGYTISVIDAIKDIRIMFQMQRLLLVML